MNECYECQRKSVLKILEKYNVATGLRASISSETDAILSENEDKPNPFVAALIHRNMKAKLAIDDLYMEEKRASNNSLLQQYRQWEHMIHAEDNPLSMAIKLAVIGNIIDYGAHTVEKDIIAQIHKLLQKDFIIDHRPQLAHAIKNARSIVYLGDNAGEIVFDKLFIEAMNHKNITYVVRGEAVLNDVTIADAKAVGMDKVATIVSNGFDAPSTLLAYSDKEFLDIYNAADLIISKGQGNFEGLIHIKDQRIFFLLIAKCKIMSEMLRVNTGDLIVMRQNILNSF